MKTKAFTLIEVMAAIAIIGIGLISLLALFPVGIGVNQLATRTTKGTMLCKEMMANIKVAVSSKQRAPNFPGEIVPNVTLTELKATDEHWYNFGQYYDDDQKVRERLGFPDDDSFDVTVTFHDEYGKTAKTADGLAAVIVTAYWPRSRGETSTLQPQQEEQRQVKLISFIRYQK